MSKTSHLLSKQNSQQPKQFRGGEKKVMKKSLSLLVAIAMVFSMFATLVSADGKAAGQKLQDLGVINGTSNGLDEDKEWLRQDVTVLIARLLGAEEAAKATANTHGFEDLDSKFYNGFVSWAKENGYFNGESATKFGVGNPITNQQFAAVLLRVLKVDVEYAEAFDKAVELGLVSKDLDKAANAIRGDIYSSLVTALDYKIDGKTLGNILGLKGYEIVDLDIAKASAVVSKTITVDFNAELDALKASDVSVTNADGAGLLIEKVSFEGSKATIALSDALSNGKTYTVKIASATSKEGSVASALSTEVTFNKATPATIAFVSKTVVSEKNVQIVIKDANGNDVTADFADDVEVYTSNSNVVDTDLSTDAIGDSIVNVSLVVDEDEDVKIETGNEIISVVALTTLGVTDVSFGGDKASDNTVTLYKDDAVNVLVAAKDQNDNEYKSIVNGLGDFDAISIKSLNPSIVQVDNDTLTAKALQTGSATVQVTTEFGGVKSTKSVVVTVKAAKGLAGIELSTSSLKLVKDATVEYTVDVKTVDQYGNAINVSEDVTAVAKNDKFSAVETSDNGEGKRVFTVSSTENGSTTIKFSVTKDGKTFSKTLSVTQADQNGLGGYLTESDAVLDFDHAGDNKADGAVNTTTIKVFKKDKNGVKFAQETGAEFASLNEDIVDVDANGNVTIVTKDGKPKTGKATVTVTVGNAIVAKVNVEVINSASQLKVVKQVKETITVKVGDNVSAELFGNGKALELVNQYEKEYTVQAGDYTIATSDSGIVDSTGLAKDDGKATITVGINGTFYVVNVVVKE